jgi:type I restriction enzyme, S subunit
VSGIPSSWVKVCFDDAIDVVSDRGYRIKQKEYLLTGLLPVVDQGEGLVGGYTNDLSAKVESNGSVIVFGDHTRRFKFVNFPFAVGADGVKLFRPAALWSSKFLYWQLGTIDLEDRGYGRHYQHLRKESLVLPPIAEQVRIVEKLEELLSDLDAGVSELKVAQKKLVQYRQSLLKAAVEGALTAEWRATNTPTETGAQLLERIQQERRARWEAKQLAKFKEQGKAPPKDWQKKYPEPLQPDTTGLPELPQGWVWASIDQLTNEQKYGSSSKTNEDTSGVPILRMGNIQEGALDFSSLKYLPAAHDEFPNLHLQDGDLLFNRTNSPELVGKTAVFRSQISPCSFASYLISVRFSEHYIPELASTFINSAHGKRWIKSVVVQQVGQANVNGSKLSALAVPLPPFDEQVEVIARLNEQLDQIVQQLKSVEISLKQSKAQRQNILKAAFSGQLVAQDPSDEPVSELLERIRAERAAQQAVKKPRGRKVKEAA